MPGEPLPLTAPLLEPSAQPPPPPPPSSTLSSATENSDLPSWAQSLLSRPSISTRRGLAWSFSPPTEESDVLVLTARSGRYIDIRFALAGEPTSTTNTAFWAFAGMSEMTVSIARPDGPGDNGGNASSAAAMGFECTAHGKWLHPIDSNRLFDVIDEGDMFLLHNGDAMEVGMMKNPHTGIVELYKEYWTAPTPAPRALVPAVVAETIESETGNAKGIIVRVGDFCQGIFQSDTEFWLERWQQRYSSGPETSWEKDSRSTSVKDGQTNLELPCMWLVDESRSPGDQVQANGQTWKIVEVFHG